MKSLRYLFGNLLLRLNLLANSKGLGAQATQATQKNK